MSAHSPPQPPRLSIAPHEGVLHEASPRDYSSFMSGLRPATITPRLQPGSVCRWLVILALLAPLCMPRRSGRARPAPGGEGGGREPRVDRRLLRGADRRRSADPDGAQARRRPARPEDAPGVPPAVPRRLFRPAALCRRDGLRRRRDPPPRHPRALAARLASARLGRALPGGEVPRGGRRRGRGPALPSRRRRGRRVAEALPGGQALPRRARRSPRASRSRSRSSPTATTTASRNSGSPCARSRSAGPPSPDRAPLDLAALEDYFRQGGRLEGAQLDPGRGARALREPRPARLPGRGAGLAGRPRRRLSRGLSRRRQRRLRQPGPERRPGPRLRQLRRLPRGHPDRRSRPGGRPSLQDHLHRSRPGLAPRSAPGDPQADPEVHDQLRAGLPRRRTRRPRGPGSRPATGSTRSRSASTPTRSRASP